MNLQLLRSLAKTDVLVSYCFYVVGSVWPLTIGSVALPCLILASINAKNLWDEHWEHEKHRPPLEERVQYPYQNIRTKAFPFGDGDKVSPEGLASISVILPTNSPADSVVCRNR